MCGGFFLVRRWWRNTRKWNWDKEHRKKSKKMSLSVSNYILYKVIESVSKGQCLGVLTRLG